MNNNEIFIKLNKNYYYPNEIITGFIYLNIVEEINCSNIKLIIKGKEIIQTNDKAQNEIMNDYDNFSNINSYKSSNKNNENDDESTKKFEYNNTIEFFKTIHYINISRDDKIPFNKYIFPFVIKLPNNIPNSFLIYDSDMHIEVIYTIKAHLIDSKNINNTIKEAIPIIIRQREKSFDYPLNYKTGFNVGSCCCEYGLSIMYINKNAPFLILGNERVSVKIKIDNKKCKLDGIPLKLTLYQKIKLFNSGNKRNKKKKKKFKEYTRCIGNFESKNYIEKNRILEDNYSINIDLKNFNNNKYLNKAKSNKYFKDKNILNKLCVNFINEFVHVEYELYINTMFLGWSVEELGVLVQLLFYPPDYYDEETEMKIANFNFQKDIVFDCTILKINSAEDYNESEYNSIIKDFKKLFENYVINNNKSTFINNNKSNIIVGNENENKIEFFSISNKKNVNNSISDESSSSFKLKNNIINNIVEHNNNNKANSNIIINNNEEDDNNEIDDSKRYFNKTKNFKFFINDEISKINKNNNSEINNNNSVNKDNSNNNIVVNNSKSEINNEIKINDSNVTDNNKIFIEQSEKNSLNTFNNINIIKNSNKMIVNNSDSETNSNISNKNIKIVLKNKKNNKYKNFVKNSKNIFFYDNKNENENITIKRELNKFWLNDKFDIIESNNEEEEEDEISNE